MQHWTYKAAAFVTLVIGVVIIMYYGSPFLQPLAFGALFAMLIHPMETAMRRRGLPKFFSISISVLLVMLFLGLILLLISWQVSELSQEWPGIKQRIQEMEAAVRTYLSGLLNVQEADLSRTIRPSADMITTQVMNVTSQAVSIMGDLLLILVFTIIFLASQKRFQAFTLEIWGREDNDKEFRAIMHASSRIAHRYLRGKLLVLLILGLLYAGGFLLAGIKFAILLALLGSLLSLIPYLGNVIAGLLAISLALVSGGGLTSILLIIGVMSVTQVVESYLLTPLILGDQVDLSPFGAVISVFGFTMVWGISGAVIAIPMTAIIRIYLAQSNQLQALGRLLEER